MTGYINWQRRRRFIHDADVLAKIVADLKAQAPDHIAVTGDLANIALPEEFARGARLAASLGSPQRRELHPRQSRRLCARAGRYADRSWGAYMRGDDGGAGFPYLRRRGPLALIGLSTARADRAVHGDRPARQRAARRGSARCSTRSRARDFSASC